MSLPPRTDIGRIPASSLDLITAGWPGKYESQPALLEAVLHDLAVVEGEDTQVGDASLDQPVFLLIPLIATDLIPGEILERLTPALRGELIRLADMNLGAIVCEEPSGFVGITFYRDTASARAAHEALRAEWEA
jgi:hypothetical protein